MKDVKKKPPKDDICDTKSTTRKGKVGQLSKQHSLMDHSLRLPATQASPFALCPFRAFPTGENKNNGTRHTPRPHTHGRTKNRGEPRQKGKKWDFCSPILKLGNTQSNLVDELSSYAPQLGILKMRCDDTHTHGVQDMTRRKRINERERER